MKTLIKCNRDEATHFVPVSGKDTTAAKGGKVLYFNFYANTVDEVLPLAIEHLAESDLCGASSINRTNGRCGDCIEIFVKKYLAFKRLNRTKSTPAN